MKTKWILMIATITMAISAASAQVKTPMELLKDEKMKFINDYCKFTDDEAGKFWPIYDELQDKLKKVKKAMRREMKDIKDRGVDNVSENELKTAMDNRKAYEQQLLDLKWEYNQKYIDAVGIKKTAKFYEGEVTFRKKLIDRLKDLKMDGDDDAGDD